MSFQSRVVSRVNLRGVLPSMRSQLRVAIEEICLQIAERAQAKVSGTYNPVAALPASFISRLGTTRKALRAQQKSGTSLNIRTGRLYRSLSGNTAVSIVEKPLSVTGIVSTNVTDPDNDFAYPAYWETVGNRPFLKPALQSVLPTMRDTIRRAIK